MKHWWKLVAVMMATPLLWAGTIKGVVKTGDSLAPGVVIALKNTSGVVKTGVSNDDGRFHFDSVGDGTYTLDFSFPGLVPHTEEDISVSGSNEVALTITLQAPLNVMESLTVTSASRRAERIVEAPAAVTVITAAEISAFSGSGQIVKVLEATPGVELAQNGVFDFNINARGFNSSLNRRVLVLIDGRDPSTGFLANQEWSAMPFPMDSLKSIEFVRGPGSALYGANAFNGVLNMTTKRPSDDLGGRLNLTLGNIGTQRLDFKYGGEINGAWSYRVTGGGAESEDWSQDRVSGVDGPPFEYPGLEGNAEVLGLYQAGNPANPTELDETQESRYISARLDGEFSGGELLTLEAGYASTERGTAVTGLGRVRVDQANRPFFRVNYNTEHWNAMANYTKRETPDGQTSLSSGNLLWEDSSNLVFEVQGNYDLMDGRMKLVGGASYRQQKIDSADASGFQSLMVAARDEDQQAVFGQIKYEVNEKLDLVAAGRWDDSSLHDSVESPKAAMVYKITPNHSLRATWGRAFQTPNYSEYYLRAVAGVIPFGALQDAVQGAFGLDLREAGILDWQNGFVAAVGNEDLVPEEVTSWEIGYKGIVSDRWFVTVDYYESEIVNFVTDLLPGVNSNIQPFTFDPSVPAVIQQTLLGTLQSILGPALFSGLTNSNTLYNPVANGPSDGNPVVTVSYANAGEVTTEGLDFAFNFYINDRWTLNGNYSWFDFKVVDTGISGDAILPNSAEHKYNFGVNYNSDSFSAGATYHYVDGYPYAAGVFSGEVPQYDTFGLNMSYNFNDNWRLDFVGSNITDDEHYELVGGSLNGARYLGTVKFNF